MNAYGINLLSDLIKQKRNIRVSITGSELKERINRFLNLEVAM